MDIFFLTTLLGAILLGYFAQSTRICMDRGVAEWLKGATTPSVMVSLGSASNQCPYMDSSSFASNLYLADMARLHTYIRPLKLAYVY